MQSAIKIYHWGVQFSDGYVLKQFDDNGKEILVRDITSPSCINDDLSIKENCNIFSDLEKTHGVVKKVGWYPFSDKLAKKCMEAQETLRIATDKELTPIEQYVPDNFYSTYLKSVNRIQYGVNASKSGVEMFPIDAIQSKLYTTFVSRTGSEEPITNEIELRYK